MHEEPQVPNFGEPGKGPELEEGMVLAIEPMVNAGGPLVRMGDDGWSVYSEDGSLAAHFEFTVAVTPDGPRILTPWHLESVLEIHRTRLAAAARQPGTLSSQDDSSRQLRFLYASSTDTHVVVCRLRSLPTAAAVPQPYGTNDAGGFRNVLPPGENGTASFNEVLAFRGPGLLPPHFADQQPLYENLLYAAPTLTEDQIPNYFKDATFGVPAGEVESEIEPRPGVTIVRDKAFGVPHVYGDTRADTMFGAGYAGAADRLFLMDVLRHTGRAELASFLGGSNAGADASQWQFAPYTEADLRTAAGAGAAALRRRWAAGGRRRQRLRRRDQRLRRRRQPRSQH